MIHFRNKQQAIQFALQEIVDTLQDDLARMEGPDADNYTPADCFVMAGKIADIQEATNDAIINFKMG